MKKIFKNISSSILFVIFWWVQALIIFLISYLIIGESFVERLFDRPPVFLGPLFLIALYTSYALVKYYNSKSFLKRIFDKMKQNNINPKTKNEIKENDVETEMLIENKVQKKRIISKGWLRLQIVSCLLLPIPLAYLYFKFFEFFSSGGLRFPFFEDIFFSYVAALFFCQWFLFLFYFLIIKYKSSIISNLWVGRHFFVSIFSGFVINYFFLIPVFDLENIGLSHFWDYSFFFPIFVVVYFLILLSYLWIARGFKDS